MEQAVEIGLTINEDIVETEYSIFRNDGLMDVRAITTFGVSAKETDSPIGYFGTGLKYAIAVLLRHGIAITIYSGHEKYEFITRPEVFRNKSFDFVYMNDQQLGFTTELGKNWQIWQAFRELYCNTLDENGEIEVENEPPTIGKDFTTIVVEGYEVAELVKQKHHMFIECDPLIETDTVDIYGGQSNAVFYRGVKIAEFKKPMMYRYNVKRQLYLTEDRTLKYTWELGDALVDGILKSGSEKLIEEILTADERFYESTLDFTDRRVTPGETFMETAKELHRVKKDKTNVSALRTFEEHKEINAPSAKEIKLDKDQQAILATSIDFLTELGHYIDDYPITVLESLGQDVFGSVNGNTIYLAERTLGLGAKTVAAAIYEEYVHIKYGFSDESRTMQNYLFETIISQGEKILGRTL